MKCPPAAWRWWATRATGVRHRRGGDGVVHALASADRPAAELGALIANAMVGTFLGILLAYGFISPLATLLRQKSAETSR